MTDSRAIKLLPIELRTREADPTQLIRRAQDEMRLELLGTQLVPRDGP